MKIILLAAITLDGKIAKNKKELTNWTSGADKKMFVDVTKQAGVIVMGKTTFDTIGRPLPDRLNIVLTSKPASDKNMAELLEFSNATPRKLVKNLEDRGFSTIILGGGAKTNGLFLKQGLIDEIWLTIEPRIFGQGVPLFEGVDTNLDLEFVEIMQLDKKVIHVKYRVKK